MKLAVGVLAVLIAATACSNAPAGPEIGPNENVVQVSVDQPFQLRVGEVGSVGNGLMIAFRRVSNDSRCPMDVVCVWMGDASVHLDLALGRMAWSPTVVHTNVDPRVAQFRDHEIRIVELAPYPQSSQPIAPGDYVVTLEVKRIP